MDILALITGTAGAVAVIVAAYFVFIRNGEANRIRRNEVAAASTVEMFQANVELNKYVDARVSTAIEPLLTKIADLEQKLGMVVSSESSTKAIVRRFFQRLMFWNEQGRKGAMPMPSPEEMERLEILDIQADTLTHAEAAAARDNNTLEKS